MDFLRGLSRQQKAKDFLQFDPRNVRPEQSIKGAERVSAEAHSSDAPASADVRAAITPMVKRVDLGELPARHSEPCQSEAPAADVREVRDETWQVTLPLFTRKGPGLIYNVHVAILETRPP